MAGFPAPVLVVAGLGSALLFGLGELVLPHSNRAAVRDHDRIKGRPAQSARRYAAIWTFEKRPVFVSPLEMPESLAMMLGPSLSNALSSLPSFSLTAPAAPAIATTSAADAAANRPSLLIFLPFPVSRLDAERVRLLLGESDPE